MELLSKKAKGMTRAEMVSSLKLPERGMFSEVLVLIDRKDQAINLCEMKYFINLFEITSRYNDEMQERKELFHTSTQTRKALHLTMIIRE